MKNPVASVVVMTFNRPDELGRCLASLATQTLDRESFEVVVVDVSTPPVDAVLAPLRDRLHLVHHPVANLGVAANRNAAARVAQGDVLAFLDDDCIASPTWLGALVSAVRREPEILAGARTVHPNPETATAAAGQVITDLVDGFFNPPGAAPRFLPGLNFAVDRRSYLALGGCNPDFGFLAAEDRDFVDRWRLAGGKLEICGGCEVHHMHRSSLGGFVRQYFNYGRGAWRYHRLRRQRRHGKMRDDVRLHVELPSRLAAPMSRVPAGWRLQVLMLMGVWQVANLAGFLFQAGSDLVSACTGSSSRRASELPPVIVDPRVDGPPE